MNATRLAARIGAILFAAFFAAACRCEEEAPVAKPVDGGGPGAGADAGPQAPPPELTYRLFDDEAQALEAVLAAEKPGVIGFGEYHQLTRTSDTLSAIARFSGAMMPALAKGASDLVVETWVSAGRCGKAEKQVVAEVDEVSERPAETADETVLLLRRAKALGVAPHILTVSCAEYEKVLLADGGLDYLAFLELVAARLGDSAAESVSSRPADAPRKIVAIYGGAMHNDVAPRAGFEAVSFARRMAELGGGPYVEIDILVPEFVAVSNLAREEPWFPLVMELSSPDRVALIDRGGGAYIILLKRGVRNPPPAQTAPAKAAPTSPAARTPDRS
jgi:hypothetical protein